MQPRQLCLTLAPGGPGRIRRAPAASALVA